MSHRLSNEANVHVNSEKCIAYTLEEHYLHKLKLQIFYTYYTKELTLKNKVDTCLKSTSLNQRSIIIGHAATTE